MEESWARQDRVEQKHFEKLRRKEAERKAKATSTAAAASSSSSAAPVAASRTEPQKYTKTLIPTALKRQRAQKAKSAAQDAEEAEIGRSEL